MWRMATIRRPLRSKRAMISPVRPRANASGLTRMRVRSIRVPFGKSVCGLRAAPSAPRLVGRRPDLGLAVRADPPLGVERPGAVLAGVLELAQAAGAAQ